MTGVLHQSLAAGRWQTFTLAEQMGNIGSEVGRALQWSRRGNQEQSERAAARALELFDLTLADKRWRYRFREVARAREITCDVMYGYHTYATSSEELEKYFLQFALAARRVC